MFILNQLNKKSIVALDPDLVAWYKMDETTGTTIADSTGNGYTGTMGGGMTASTATTTGHAGGNALAFDGTDDEINCGDIAELNSCTEFTIMAWVKDTGHGTNRRIFGKSYDDYTYDLDVAFYGGEIYFECGNGINKYTHWPDYYTAITEGDWYHLAVSFLADTRIRIIVNGVIELENTSYGIPSVTYDFSGVNFIIGHDTAFSDAHFKGAFEDFRIYSRELTEAEISTIAGI